MEKGNNTKNAILFSQILFKENKYAVISSDLHGQITANDILRHIKHTACDSVHFRLFEKGLIGSCPWKWLECSVWL